MKLQLLQPRGGVSPTPLFCALAVFCALAAGATDTAATPVRAAAAKVTAAKVTAAKAATGPRISLLIESLLIARPPEDFLRRYPNPVNIHRTPTPTLRLTQQRLGD